jgi:hypothetical protein
VVAHVVVLCQLFDLRESGLPDSSF